MAFGIKLLLCLDYGDHDDDDGDHHNNDDDDDDDDNDGDHDDDDDDDCGHLRSSLNASLCCKTSQSVVKTFSTQTLINKCSFQKNQRWKHGKEKRHLFTADGKHLF